MPSLNKRLCVKCGVMQPLDTFEKGLGDSYKWVCKNHPLSEEDKKILHVKKKGRKQKRKYGRSISQAASYQEARHRGPRRVTQMKASRMPSGIPNGMTANDYAIYLTSPHWTKFKSRYVNDHEWVCFVCNEAADDLHHHNYARLGNESTDDVTPLCHKHHKEVHRVVRSGVNLGNAHAYVRSLYRTGGLDIKVSNMYTEAEE